MKRKESSAFGSSLPPPEYIHLYVIFSGDVLNFNVWFLLKCKFSFIMSGVGPEILDLEQTFCAVGANSEDQGLKLPPYVWNLILGSHTCLSNMPWSLFFSFFFIVAWGYSFHLIYRNEKYRHDHYSFWYGSDNPLSSMLQASPLPGLLCPAPSLLLS